MTQNPNPSVRPIAPLPVRDLNASTIDTTSGLTDATTRALETPTSPTARTGQTMPRNGNVPLSPPPPPNAQARRTPQGRSPGQPSLEQLVRLAFDEGYSDIHLGVAERPRMRDRGEMMLLDFPEIDTNTFYSWMREILTEDEIQRFKLELEFDGATQYDFARVRINIFDSIRGAGDGSASDPDEDPHPRTITPTDRLSGSV